MNSQASLENQLSNHGPFAALFTGMIILGSVVNKNSTDAIIEPQENWCNDNIVNLKELISTMPSGLGVATVIVVLIFPLVPIFINSQYKNWNEFKFEIVKCHVVGQGSAFGVSELLRHFIISPEPMFLNKCNITIAECSNKTYSLPSKTNVTSFCRVQNSNDLFNSLHHFPDNTCCFIGASIVTFLATLYFWSRINRSGKSIYELHSIKQCILIILQIVCIIFVMTYLYYLLNTFDGVQFIGILIGGIVQLMIICSTLPKKQNK